MGCLLGKLATVPGSSLFFPAGAATTTTAGGGEEVRLKAPQPEHIAAVKKDASGWPLWLSEAAGDALRGWAPRCADAFHKLEKIGSGTYSNVYKAIDVESGRVVALKKVRVDGVGEAESARFMAREIALIRRLGDHPNVVRLEGLVTSRLNTAPSLYLVFEYMDHDLTGLAACASASGGRLSLPQKREGPARRCFPATLLLTNAWLIQLCVYSWCLITCLQVKCYMKQLLSGIEHCHNNGVLHRDIKSSNLLVSNDGVLKIADFGLATSYDPDNMRPMTSQVITLWYRPPELLLGATHYGVGVDLWSVGCILAELLLGEPIFPGRTEVEQLHKIFKLCGTPSEYYWKKMKFPQPTFKPYERCIAEKFKDVPPATLSLLETLLSIDPDMRGTATDALNSEFFRTEPYACEPSSLPRYPPCKERDVKLKYEKHKRKSRVNGSVERHTTRKHTSQNPGRRVFTPDVNNKPQGNPKVPRLVTSTSTTKLERFPPPHLDASIGYSLDSLADGTTQEFFTSSVVELKKMPNLIFGHMKSYLNSPKKGMHKAKPGLNMAPSTILISAFRPYSLGHPMEVRRKNREQFRGKGKPVVGAVK
ncbi:probable serine/threonine-protein kinase At1g54610 isoform X1 [Phragmites australis]|uniref:probable serine/threonine-protein kinase At1g54610 isoform X1 n=1 Tax=Phragmites australis TaxID=29695 RepID=UPI002D788DB5|nr:probable serine/threonine-protein kinase At1g54610 isoform X1 [Phragmites australis]